jgi:hypothetical protein
MVMPISVHGSMVVVKFAPSGAAVLGGIISNNGNGGSNMQIAAIRTDSIGNIYMIGSYTVANDPFSPPVYNMTADPLSPGPPVLTLPDTSSQLHTVVFKYDVTGTVQGCCTFIDTVSSVGSMAIDSKDNVYISVASSSLTGSDVFDISDPVNSTLRFALPSGSNHYSVIKYSSNIASAASSMPFPFASQPSRLVIDNHDSLYAALPLAASTPIYDITLPINTTTSLSTGPDEGIYIVKYKNDSAVVLGYISSSLHVNGLVSDINNNIYSLAHNGGVSQNIHEIDNPFNAVPEYTIGAPSSSGDSIIKWGCILASITSYVLLSDLTITDKGALKICVYDGNDPKTIIIRNAANTVTIDTFIISKSLMLMWNGTAWQYINNI